ncbi:MAG: hypothetical protein PHQ80_01945 [Candidatus ainarchaeum sp.]|nr:hypothetical protein [Candidatus ainarchaeum sp.]MDD5096153.1 hypothetical protein [Candidatus ainarchaeum sp.]
MNAKNALFALLLLGYAFAGLSISDYSVSPETIEPGGSGYITLTVSNPSETDTVDLVTVSVSSAESLGANRQFAVGDLEQSSSTTLTVPFQSSPSLRSRIYTVDVTARGTVETYVYNSVTGDFRVESSVVTKLATIPIKVVKAPILSISLSSENLEDITEQTITITNSGGNASNLRMSITSSGVGFLNTDEVLFGAVEDSAQQAVTIDARGASDGATKLAFLVTYRDELGEEHNATKEVPVTIKKGEGDFRFSQQAPVTTGEDDTLTMIVTNSGDPVQDLQLTFSTSSGVVLRGLNKVEVGNLARGESREISIPLVANLQPGTNNVNASLSWVEQGENREGSITIPLSVKSDSEVGVYLEANPTPLVAGGQHTLSVTVSNLGSYSIQGVTVGLDSDALTLLTVQPEQYIGGLDKDDFSSVQYKVLVGNVQPGNHNATVEVRYKDASGARITETKPVVIRIEAPAQSGDGTGTLLLLIVVLGGAGYWYFRMRKPKVKQ